MNMYKLYLLISDKLSHISNVRWAVYSARLVLEKFEYEMPIYYKDNPWINFIYKLLKKLEFEAAIDDLLTDNK